MTIAASLARRFFLNKTRSGEFLLFARNKLGAFAARCRSYGFSDKPVGAASCRDSPLMPAQC